MRLPATPGWGPLAVVVGGPTPLLAEGPGGCYPLFPAGICLWLWCGGVVRVCGCVTLWLVVPPLLRGPGVSVCVLCAASRWCLSCVGLLCAGLACVCVCACGVSSVWVLGYVISALVRVVGRHLHHKRQERRSCKCVACGWVGGRVFRPLSLSPTLVVVCRLCLCFAARWYLLSVEVRLGVVPRVTVSLRGSVLCLALPVGCPFFSVVRVSWLAILVR